MELLLIPRIDIGLGLYITYIQVTGFRWKLPPQPLFFWGASLIGDASRADEMGKDATFRRHRSRLTSRELVAAKHRRFTCHLQAQLVLRSVGCRLSNWNFCIRLVRALLVKVKLPSFSGVTFPSCLQTLWEHKIMRNVRAAWKARKVENRSKMREFAWLVCSCGSAVATWSTFFGSLECVISEICFPRELGWHHLALRLEIQGRRLGSHTWILSLFDCFSIGQQKKQRFVCCRCCLIVSSQSVAGVTLPRILQSGQKVLRCALYSLTLFFLSWGQAHGLRHWSCFHVRSCVSVRERKSVSRRNHARAAKVSTFGTFKRLLLVCCAVFLFPALSSHHPRCHRSVSRQAILGAWKWGLILVDKTVSLIGASHVSIRKLEL